MHLLSVIGNIFCITYACKIFLINYCLGNNVQIITKNIRTFENYMNTLLFISILQWYVDRWICFRFIFDVCSNVCIWHIMTMTMTMK